MRLRLSNNLRLYVTDEPERLVERFAPLRPTLAGTGGTLGVDLPQSLSGFAQQRGRPARSVSATSVTECVRLRKLVVLGTSLFVILRCSELKPLWQRRQRRLRLAHWASLVRPAHTHQPPPHRET